MKSLPVIIPLALLFFLVSTSVEAKTSIDISNNGDGSTTSVSVRSSTGNNYINGQKVESDNGSNTTVVKINGKTVVDETTDGDNETDISVKAEGNKEPEVKYEVKKKDSPSATVKKVVKDAKKEEVKKQLNDIEAEVKQVVSDRVPEPKSILGRLEKLFDKLRSLFGN